MKIFIQNLEDGIYEFSGTVTAAELELVEAQVYPEAIKVLAIVDRLDNIFRIKLTVDTVLHLVCDRCLEKFTSGFHEVFDRIYQVGSGTLDGDDEVEIIPEGSREIDLCNALSEAFIIARPIQVVCKEECKGLCSNCGINLNIKGCTCSTNSTDPRLEKLKFLLKEE
jgi:uncharacterized protein